MRDLVVKVLLGALGSMVISACMYALYAAATRPATQRGQSGEIVLRQSPLRVKLLGLLIIGGPMVLIVISFFLADARHPNARYYAQGMFAALLLVGILFTMYFARKSVVVSGVGLEATGIRSKPRHIAWNDVVRVRCWTDGSLVIESLDGTKIVIEPYTPGLSSMFGVLQHRLSPRLREDCRKDLARFRKQFQLEETAEDPTATPGSPAAGA